MEPVLNDPPKARETGSDSYRPLDDLLDCDIVTCHTPLTFDGPDPTYRLIGEAFLARLKPGAWFCNAGRGEVVHEAALHRALDEKRLGAVVLDVWDHEPEIDGRLLARVDIGTPHIAGYSLEGKLNGTGDGLPRGVPVPRCRAVVECRGGDAAAPRRACRCGGFAEDDDGARASRSRRHRGARRRRWPPPIPSFETTKRCRKTVGMSAAERGRAFDLLRKTYPVRREFS